MTWQAAEAGNFSFSAESVADLGPNNSSIHLLARTISWGVRWRERKA